jgi:hypothetical protein
LNPTSSIKQTTGTFLLALVSFFGTVSLVLDNERNEGIKSATDQDAKQQQLQHFNLQD